MVSEGEGGSEGGGVEVGVASHVREGGRGEGGWSECACVKWEEEERKSGEEVEGGRRRSPRRAGGGGGP